MILLVAAKVSTTWINSLKTSFCLGKITPKFNFTKGTQFKLYYTHLI